MFWVLVMTATLFVLARAAKSLLEAPLTKLTLFPGVLIATAARVLGCWLSGTRLEAINLWRRGGPVEHAKPNLWGRLLFAVLLPATAAACVLFAHAKLAPELTIEHALPSLEPSLEQTALVVQTTSALLENFVAALRSLPESADLKLIAFLWLSISTLLYCAPRYEELKDQIVLVLGAWGLSALAGSWGIGPRFLSRAWFARWFYGETIREALGVVLTMTLVSAALLALLYAGSSLVRALVLPRRRTTE